jgi:DNA repair ATPase RecN
MLKEINLKNVGPAPKIDLDCASRLNILTGDNGLGKTFLLDIIWWCLNGQQGKSPINFYQKPGRGTRRVKSLVWQSLQQKEKR